MMTYEEYQNRTIVNIEAMRETRRQQGEEQQLLQAEIAKIDFKPGRQMTEMAVQ